MIPPRSEVEAAPEVTETISSSIDLNKNNFSHRRIRQRNTVSFFRENIAVLLCLYNDHLPIQFSMKNKAFLTFSFKNFLAELWTMIVWTSGKRGTVGVPTDLALPIFAPCAPPLPLARSSR
jgi:hypothetical protein